MSRSFPCLALSLLVACASTSGGSSPGAADSSSGATPRPVVGDACDADYRADLDATAVALEVPRVGLVGALVIGDGWRFDCRPSGDRLLAGENESLGRLLTVTIDREAPDVVDVEDYATAQLERTLERMHDSGMTNIRAAQPHLVAPSTYVLAFEADAEGTHFAQLNVHHVFSSPIGLIRYHVSETAADGRILDQHAGDLVRAAAVFGPIPESALDEGAAGRGAQ